MLRFTSFVLLFATACATDPADGVATGASDGKADGASASLTFAADFTQTLHGTLLAGTSVHVVYDLARLQTCRAESNNTEVWGVTGWAQFDSAAPVSFAVSRLDAGHVVPVAADLPLPASAGHVALWFQITNEWAARRTTPTTARTTATRSIATACAHVKVTSTELTIQSRTAIPCTLTSSDKTSRCMTSRATGCAWPIAPRVWTVPKTAAQW